MAASAAAHAERQRALLAAAGLPPPAGPVPPPMPPPPGMFPPPANPAAAAMFPGLHSHMLAQQAAAAAGAARARLPEEEFEIPEFTEEDVRPKGPPQGQGAGGASAQQEARVEPPRTPSSLTPATPRLPRPRQQTAAPASLRPLFHPPDTPRAPPQERERERKEAEERERKEAEDREREAAEAFRELLREKGLSSLSKWDTALPKLAHDPRFKAVANHNQRRRLFDAFVKQRAEEERRGKREVKKQAVDGFTAILDEIAAAAGGSLPLDLTLDQIEAKYKCAPRTQRREGH